MNTLPKHVFCIGLGGVGVSGVAQLFFQRGIKVSGSDPNPNPLVEDLMKLGVAYYIDEDPRHITKDVDLVVFTDDTAPEHPMRRRATELGINAENFSSALGQLMNTASQRITIAGTNGKSTTTALAGLLMADAGLDPTVLVGSRVSEFNSNVRNGTDGTFVVEADEYRDHYLHYQPTIAVITNIEADHLDYFGSVEKMLQSFEKYVALLPTDGKLVVNADDERCVEIAKRISSVITFGIHHDADLMAKSISTGDGWQKWETLWKGELLGNFTLHLPGEFNIMNCLAAMATAIASGAEPKTFAATVDKFHGVWRRFQILNPGSPTTIVSDYAHHPIAVKATIEGAKAFFPGRRIVAVFQPHHRSRLTSLFDDFTKNFGAAETVLIVETYTVPGREVPEKNPKSSQNLVDALTKLNIDVHYVASPEYLESALPELLQPGDVAIIMGAGDIWRSAEKIAERFHGTT